MAALARVILERAQPNFEKSLIVRISENFQFTGKLIDRSRLTFSSPGALTARAV